jgi:signal transduction histidine kinase
MSPQSIVRWFAPPEFARVDLRNRARALWIVSWPFFVVVFVLLALAALMEPHTLVRRATTIAAVGGLMTVLHATSRAGRPVLASWMLVTGLSVIVTQRAWGTGGIHAPVAVFYVVFIVMAGILLGVRGAIATAAVCITGAIVLTFGTALGWVAPRPGAGGGPALDGFVLVLLAISIALVLYALVTFRPRREGLDADAVHLLVGDMRSPMQVLVSHLEVLRRELRGESAKDAEAALSGVRTLRRMTNSLLDVSRLEVGRMPLRRSMTDLSGLAHAIVAAVRAVQPTCDIAVETRGDSMCNCDPDLTRRTIENLVSNALVTTIDGRVRVVIAGSQDRASIAVTDEGPAVPPKHRTQIFEPFRADRLQRVAADESSGLGLAFCRLAIEAQGGTIRVEDGSPCGNVFVVELPR